MSFVYLPRKQEDVDLQHKLIKGKRELTKEYQDKRSDYDKDLELYNKFIRKLDGYSEGSIEHKNLLTDIDVYLAKLQTKDTKSKDDTKKDDTKSKDDTKKDDTKSKDDKPKQKRVQKKKEPVLLLDD
jgi:hypothetical protein